jgi:hypothetical protein
MRLAELGAAKHYWFRTLPVRFEKVAAPLNVMLVSPEESEV